jgi:hypothetical protein
VSASTTTDARWSTARWAGSRASATWSSAVGSTSAATTVHRAPEGGGLPCARRAAEPPADPGRRRARGSLAGTLADGGSVSRRKRNPRPPEWVVANLPRYTRTVRQDPLFLLDVGRSRRRLPAWQAEHPSGTRHIGRTPPRRAASASQPLLCHSSHCWRAEAHRAWPRLTYGPRPHRCVGSAPASTSRASSPSCSGSIHPMCDAPALFGPVRWVPQTSALSGRTRLGGTSMIPRPPWSPISTPAPSIARSS